MALVKLSPAEITEFLQSTSPTMLGVVGTLGVDGYPHLVPVWYRYDGARVHIWTLETRAWVKNIARDNRVAFSVQEDDAASRGVTIRGRATSVTSHSQAVSDEIRQITRRYVEAPEVENYISRWTHLRTIVTLTPEKISGWRDDGASN